MNIKQFDGHTPGPWDYEYGPTVSDHEDDTDILTVKTPPTFDEDKAWVNQRLAAAAPDLLAEVERLRDLVDFAIAVIDSNHCYMGEEAQADLLNYLRGENE